MPIYEYICQECGERYDKFVRSRSAKIELECPSCGSGRGEKALSAFSSRSSGGAAVSSVSSGPACGPVG
jgi:putative FmdB family regulatory protein